MVDDGSSDGTDKVLGALGDSTVRVINHPHNKGKGAAIRTGLEAIRGDLVLIQDADLEYDPADWPKLLEPILRGKARVVYGSRFTGERKNMLPLHWVGNRFLSLVTNVLYSSTLSDMETCYKLFDRRVLEGITIESDRFEFEPEITAKVLRRGYRIYEVPISYAGRELDEGKKITWRDGFGALKALVKFRFIRLDLVIEARPRRRATGVGPRPDHDGRRRGRGQLRVGPGPGPVRRRPAAEGAGRVGGGGQRLDRRLGRRGPPRLPRGGGGRPRRATWGTGRRPTGGWPPPPRRWCWCAIPISRSARERWPRWPRRWPRPGVRAGRAADPHPRRHALPVGPPVPLPDRRRRARPVRHLRPRQPVHPLLPPGHSWTGRSGTRAVDWVSGACFLVRRSAFEQVGGFDEAYFMYAEDVDLCWRLGRAGWTVAYLPTAEVTHLQGVSTDRHPYRMILEHHRSLLRFAGRSSRGWRRALLPLVALGIGARAVPGLPGAVIRPMTGATGAPDPRL